MTADDLIDAALRRSEGDRDWAMRLLAYQCLLWHRGVSTGFIREGAQCLPGWEPEPEPDAVLTSGNR